MKERSRKLGVSPPTAEEIFRDYCAPRTDAVHSLTNGAAAAQRLGLQRRRFVKPSLLLRLQYSSFGFSSDFTIVNWAASATGYRASYLELALIQFANDISSEAHVEVMRKVRVGMYEYQLESMFLHHMRRIIVQLYMDLLLLDCAALKFCIGAVSEDAPLCCVGDF